MCSSVSRLLLRVYDNVHHSLQPIPSLSVQKFGHVTIIPLFHPGLSKIPARIWGPGSDIINFGITMPCNGGQKFGAGQFLIPDAGPGLTSC